MPENEPHLRTKLRRIWGENKPGFDGFLDNCFVQSAAQEHYADAAQDLAFILDSGCSPAIKRDEVGLVLIDPGTSSNMLDP